MAARIKAARELGDLKENAEYHIAKDDQAHLETKIKRLRFQLQNAEVVEVDKKADVFTFGRTAEILDEESGKVHTWTLVGGAEADLSAGRISVEAPIGNALRDAPVGKSIVIRDTPAARSPTIVERLKRLMPEPLIEFPADDPERALGFWRGVLGVSLEPRGESAGSGWETADDGLRLGVHERGAGARRHGRPPLFHGRRRRCGPGAGRRARRLGDPPGRALGDLPGLRGQRLRPRRRAARLVPQEARDVDVVVADLERADLALVRRDARR